MRKEIVTGLAVAAGLIAIVYGAVTAKAADKGGPPATLADTVPAVAVAPSCYVQGLAGSSITTVGGSALPASVSASGWTVGAGIGCDMRFDRIVIGALARIEAPVDTDGSLVDFEKSWAAAARVGYMLNTGLMIYGLAGYESADFDLGNVSFDRDGWLVGGGLEVMISQHLSLTAEYTTTILNDANLGGLKIEPESHKARLGLTYRFNSLFGE